MECGIVRQIFCMIDGVDPSVFRNQMNGNIWAAAAVREYTVCTVVGRHHRLNVQLGAYVIIPYNVLIAFWQHLWGLFRKLIPRYSKKNLD